MGNISMGSSGGEWGAIGSGVGVMEQYEGHEEVMGRGWESKLLMGKGGGSKKMMEKIFGSRE